MNQGALSACTTEMHYLHPGGVWRVKSRVHSHRIVEMWRVVAGNQHYWTAVSHRHQQHIRLYSSHSSTSCIAFRRRWQAKPQNKPWAPEQWIRRKFTLLMMTVGIWKY